MANKIGDGWKLVPREVTEEMCQAIDMVTTLARHAAKRDWRYMAEAAPIAPTEALTLLFVALVEWRKARANLIKVSNAETRAELVRAEDAMLEALAALDKAMEATNERR